MQRSGRRYLLQGLMVCQCCKYTYCGISNIKGGRSYYRCSGTDVSHSNENRICSSKSIHADILEKIVWEEVKMVLKKPEMITKVGLAKYENEQVKKELDFIISSIESFFSEVELEADYETKFDIIKKLVQRIEIDDDNVHIVFRLREFALERQKKSVQHCIGMPMSNTSVTKESTGITNRLQEILLTARCDRVEYLSNEQVAIIDYKLGSPPSNEEVMSGFFPQLILQALAVEYTTKKEVSELAYWKLDYDRVKVIALKDYKQKIEEFQNDLPGFLSNYLRDMTSFVASPYFDKFLRFNSYKQLERVGEWL